MTRLGILFVGSIALVASACGPKIVTKPDVYEVETLAVASVYVNREVHHIEKSGEQEASLGDLLKAAAKVDETELQELARQGLEVYASQLNDLDQFKVMPIDRMIGDERYQAAYKSGLEGTKLASLGKAAQAMAKAGYVTPEGVHYIPLKAVTSTDGTVTLGNKNPHEEGQQYVANLCKELGVDGVALVELDLGYRFPKLGVTVNGTKRGKPSVSGKVVIVRKDGSVVVRYLNGKREEGTGVPLITNNHVNLDNEKVRTSFNMAIAQSAQQLKDTLGKEL